MCMWGIYPGVLCVCGVFTLVFYVYVGVFTLVFYVYVGYLPWCFMCMCHAWSFMSKRLKKYIRRSVPEQYFILSYIIYIMEVCLDSNIVLFSVHVHVL